MKIVDKFTYDHYFNRVIINTINYVIIKDFGDLRHNYIIILTHSSYIKIEDDNNEFESRYNKLLKMIEKKIREKYGVAKVKMEVDYDNDEIVFKIPEKKKKVKVFLPVIIDKILKSLK